MNVVLSDPDVVALIRERGGRLYVWTTPQRCCGGGAIYLETGTEPVRGRVFHRAEAEGFELYVDFGRRRAPAEIVLEVRGLRKRRVEAYWEGCVFAA